MNLRRAAVMSMHGWNPGQPDLLYHPPSGELRVGEVREWDQARHVLPEEYPLVRSMLCDRLQSEIRYGAPKGWSLQQRDRLSVLRHSIWVADRCMQLAEGMGFSRSIVLACGFKGAKHDLHEGLPGIRDQHGPALRWYRSCSLEVDSAYRLAEKTATRVAGLPMVIGADNGIADVIVKYADRDAMAVERAVLFKDCPSWLEERTALVDECRRIGYGYSTPYTSDSDDLADWLDAYLADPEAMSYGAWDRAPVQAEEYASLHLRYNELQCSASTM